jgi:phage replication-related protein YjqB (UPF0714/DUF867 family)
VAVQGLAPKGAFEHWHITSTDIHEASFPLLNSVISRGCSHAVAFHGFDDDDIPHDILVGGLACEALKEKITAAIEGVVGSDFTVHITKPDEPFGGDDKRNIVNRLTAGGRHGVQIEQTKGLERNMRSRSPMQSPTSTTPSLGHIPVRPDLTRGAAGGVTLDYRCLVSQSGAT